jgi:phospholipid/cholesterol/gamma-HCH transport system substrate-binding protein
LKRAIREHWKDFAAIACLLVVTVAVAGYILTNERPSIPFISPSTYTLNADFSTAQAVTPGQGQSVRISGVQIGLITGVSLKNGEGVVKMSIDKKYEGLIRTNWTALIRPRTGLDDMFIELSPGIGSAPAAKSGYTIPVSNTMPVVNLDEILSSLDQDSREYLDLLVNGASQGLQSGGGDQLAQVMERFEPTHRDLARVNQAVAQRGTDLRQLVNSLKRLNVALAAKQPQIVQLIDSSEKVFSAFASENGNVSRAVADLPSTLNQTTATLAKVQAFAQQLGPAATNLLPAAGALKGANQALTALAVPGAPIVQNQIRPFVIAARPVVRNLRTLFSVQDANGDFRPLFLQASCATYAQLVNSSPLTEVLMNLTPILTDAGLCPAQAAADQAAYAKYKEKHPATATASSNSTPSSVPALSPHAGSNSGGSGQGNLFLPKLPTSG